MPNRHLLQKFQRAMAVILSIALLAQSGAPAFVSMGNAGSRTSQTAPATIPPSLPQPDVPTYPAPPVPPEWETRGVVFKHSGLAASKRVAQTNDGIPLVSGWNLASVPLESADTSPAAVLDSIAGNYDQVFAYDACDAADPWKLYDPADPGNSDLAAIDHTIGLWIDVSSDASLTISGTQPVSVTIPLCTGWNLIGYPLSRPQTVGNALSSIAGRYSRVYAYEAAADPDPWDVHSAGVASWGNDLQLMMPGWGYWLYATEDTTLVMSEPAGADITLPVVTVLAAPEIVNIGETVYLNVSASDDTAIVALSLSVNGVDVPLDATGNATYIPAAPGLYTAVGTAEDLEGNLAQETVYFRVRTASDNGAPTVALTSPATDAIIETPTDLVGTAADTDLVFYELQARAEGTSAFNTFLQGFSEVNAAVLGTLDPRAFVPGLYQLRLCAEDTWGNQACTGVLRYDLNPPAPLPGIMRLAFLDGQVNAAGFPLTVQRIYDSRDKTQGDFGVGWHIAFGDVKLTANRIMGNNWQEQQSGFVFSIVATADHRLTISLPDGSFHRFRMHPVPHSQAFTPISTLDGVAFEPLGNTTSQLTTSNPPAFFDSLAGAITDSSGGIYSPSSYVLTLREGTRLTFSRNGPVSALTYRLTQIRDRNGNILTISPTGISHSAGATIGITRDTQGRITAVTNGNGDRRTYSYDANGDLVQTTDFDDYVTQYRYDDNHNLIQIVDPRGSVPGTLIYDEQGRIVATIDADGNRVEIEHDEAAGQEIVFDHLGNRTVISYDDHGNTISILDAHGKETVYTYDSQDRLLAETDPLGRTTTYSYDTQGNRLSMTNPLSQTITWTYNSRGQVLTENDPLGRTISNSYDSQGNLVSITNPLGERISYEYDGSGNQTAVIDPAGNRTELAYDSRGRLIERKDALGHIVTATYDNNGLLLSQSITLTTATGVEVVTTRNSYDRSGRLLQRTDPNGQTINVTYSPMGEPTTILDRNDNAFATTYDNEGRITQASLPNGATMNAAYDPRGLVISQSSFNGQLATIGYDALSRPTTVTNADGSNTGKGYDDAGQLTSFTDENGNLLTVAYDAAGRRITTDKSGMLTDYAYDAAGQLISVTDANSQTTAYEYDDAGRLMRVSLPDSGVVTMSYDSLGRKISQTDPMSNTTRFGYDALGHLTVVTDTLDRVTHYTYNEAGNLIAVNDALGRTTTMTYDTLGQLVQRTLPSGDFETFSYDDNGNVASHTDFNGQTTTYSYDSLNRVTSKSYEGGDTVTFSYLPGGQLASVTDASSTTTFTYDSRNRLAGVNYPDGTAIAYSYDAAGNLIGRTTPATAITYTYDSQDRLATVADPDTGVTSYSYDNTGNIVGITYPNSTTAAIAYDGLNRPLTVTNRRADNTVISAYEYSYDAAGNRTEIIEQDGTTITYSYDSLYRLVREIKTAPGGATVYDTSYTYDAVGNRLTKTDSNGTVTYSYDVNDRLLAAGDISYTYDANGNQLSQSDPSGSTTYSYDPENRLTGVNTPSDVITYSYNGLGARTAQTADGIPTRYLVDFSLPHPEVLEERNAAGTVTAAYVLGHGAISTNQGGAITYYHYDAHGSVRQLTDSSQAVTDEYVYDAFGLLLDHSGASTNPYLYTAEQYDAATGLYFLRARYYNPIQGRFLARDSFFGSPADPRSLNKYIYALNNPVMLTDPSGRVSAAESLMVAQIITTLAAMQALIGFNVFYAHAIMGENPAYLRPPAHAARFALSASGSAGFLTAAFGFGAGIEVLRFTEAANLPTSDLQFYASFPSLAVNVGVGLGPGLAASVEVGHIFNCTGNPRCYEGLSIGLSASFGVGVGAANESVSLSGVLFGTPARGGSSHGYAIVGGIGISPPGDLPFSFSVGYTVSYSTWLPDLPSALAEYAHIGLNNLLDREYNPNATFGELQGWLGEAGQTAWDILFGN